jgi:hypothetical protein
MRVGSTTNLVAGIWTTLTNNISGTGNTLPATDFEATTQTGLFYRVRLVP